jgi:hypothetical protein
MSPTPSQDIRLRTRHQNLDDHSDDSILRPGRRDEGGGDKADDGEDSEVKDGDTGWSSALRPASAARSSVEDECGGSGIRCISTTRASSAFIEAMNGTCTLEKAEREHRTEEQQQVS